MTMNKIFNKIISLGFFYINYPKEGFSFNGRVGIVFLYK